MVDLQNCNAAHAAAGLGADNSSIPQQSEADKINAMPENASFCKTQMSSMTCNLRDFTSRDTLCHSMRVCETSCAYKNVAQALAGKNRNIRIEARKAMNSCIESRNRVNKLLGK